MAHMRYEFWGNAAEAEGFPNVARLLRAIASAETIHARNHFEALRSIPGDHVCTSMAVFGLGGTTSNLQGGIDGETYEINEMYPTYLETARFQKVADAQRSFHYALSAEKTHAELFTRAKEAIESSGKDMQLGPVRVCQVCGWTHEGDIPDRCPICGATRERFVSWE